MPPAARAPGAAFAGRRSRSTLRPVTSSGQARRRDAPIASTTKIFVALAVRAARPRPRRLDRDHQGRRLRGTRRLADPARRRPAVHEPRSATRDADLVRQPRADRARPRRRARCRPAGRGDERGRQAAAPAPHTLHGSERAARQRVDAARAGARPARRARRRRAARDHGRARRGRRRQGRLPAHRIHEHEPAVDRAFPSARRDDER